MSQYLNFLALGNWDKNSYRIYPEKFDKITQSTRICIKHSEDKDVHIFNIHINPDGITYTVSNEVLIKLLYCTEMYYYEYKKYVKYVFILFVYYILLQMFGVTKFLLYDF